MMRPQTIAPEEWGETPIAVQQLLLTITEQLDHCQTMEKQLLMNVPLEELNDKPARILVVDDNSLNLDILARRLNRQGYEVDKAVNGIEALQKIRSSAFDLVLLDIMMPEMDGYEVLEILQKEHRLHDLSVIVITAVDDIKSVVRCIEMGAVDHLPKPFNPTVLKARIGASLEKKRLRDQQKSYIARLNLENERKSQELEQARAMQQALLPLKPPHLDYLHIAAIQQTATEVGGDYYEFFRLPDGRLRAVIGDATGHGAASGLMAAATKAALYATSESDLGGLVNQINYILSSMRLPRTMNMALLIAEFQPRDDGSVTVTISGGGMPPIYIWRTEGMLEEVLISGLPLGITTEATYKPTMLTLSPSEHFLLMTDGLPEIFNTENEILGFARMGERLQQLSLLSLDPHAAIAEVLSIGQSWQQDAPMRDDITLVMIHINP